MAQRLATIVGAFSCFLIAVPFLGGSEARAAPMLILAGDSNGSTLSNCVGNACGSSAVPPVTSLGLSTFTLGVNTTFPFNVTGDTLAVPLAELTMTTGNNPSGSASFNYNMDLVFTTPSGSLPHIISSSITEMGTGANSQLDLSGFSVPSTFMVDGVTLSNFAFVTVPPANATSSFSGGTWSVTRGSGGPGGTASLELVADVTAAPAPPDVPEPGSLALLVGALAGMGLMRRRKRILTTPWFSALR